MAEPDQKKLKVEMSKPGVKSGIMSASRSAAFEDFEDPIVIPVEDVTKEDFFPAGFDCTKEEFVINETCNISHWSGDHFSEDSVRDDIYAVLLDHVQQMGIQCYVEEQLKTIFKKHAEKWGEQIPLIQEKEQGLVLKLSSKPGLCFLRGREIVVGEIKQKPSYDMNWAKRQCAVYCYGVLYYYRVFLGIPVDRVYGFYLSGPNCNDLVDQYAVGIMEVSSPKSLGGTYEASQYRELFDITSSDGLQLLTQFLKDGKRAYIGIAQTRQIHKDNRGPCRFPLPANLWEPDQDISIVRGGTAAMVFKLPYSRLFGFLKQNIICEKESDLHWKMWMKKNSIALDGDAASNKVVYLKVRTRDSTVRFRDGFQATWRGIKDGADYFDSKEKQNACTEFLDTYIIEPFETSTFSMCIMADRGKPFRPFLQDKTGKKISHLQFALDELKCNAYLLADLILHSDILVHNIVIDESNKLHLVDYDEGLQVDKSLPRRFLDTNPDDEFKWLQAMFYPNSLRHYGKRYTQVQLIALMFLSLYGGTSPESWNKQYMEQMERLGTILNDAFSNNDTGWEHKKGSLEEAVLPVTLLELIGTLWEKLPTFVADTVDV